MPVQQACEWLRAAVALPCQTGYEVSARWRILCFIERDLETVANDAAAHNAGESSIADRQRRKRAGVSRGMRM